MNVVNRLLAIGLILILIAGVTLAAALPAEMLAILLPALTTLKGLADRLLPAGRLLVGGAGLALNLLLVVWLWLEIRRRRHRTVRVKQADGAAAEVTTDTLTERLEMAVDGLAGVVGAQARVRSYDRTVEVMIEAEITPETPVTVTAGRIAATVRDVTETALGLKLRGKPKIRIKAIRLPEISPALLAREAAQAEPEAAAEKDGTALPPPKSEPVTELPSPPQS